MYTDTQHNAVHQYQTTTIMSPTVQVYVCINDKTLLVENRTLK